MDSNTNKTMAFIIGAVYDFCTDNKDWIARFRIDIHGKETVNVEATIEEAIGSAHLFRFDSTDDFRLDCAFADFREYAADFRRRHK